MIQKASKIPRRPKLDGLMGASIIPSALRDALNIPDGVLIAPFKKFSDVKRLINDYLQSQICPDDSRILYDIIIIALDNISKLTIKELKSPGKGVSIKMVMINRDCIIISQVLVMARYCMKIKLFLENTSIKKMFTLEYANAIKIKRKEEKEKKRKEEIQDAEVNLMHKGQMLMYNAADRSYYEINANLERGKGKRKATTANEEEGSDDERSGGQENLDNKDEDDRGNRMRLRHESLSDSEENHSMFWLEFKLYGY